VTHTYTCIHAVCLSVPLSHTRTDAAVERGDLRLLYFAVAHGTHTHTHTHTNVHTFWVSLSHTHPKTVEQSKKATYEHYT